MSRAFRLGVFIVTTLALLGLGVFLIGNKRFLFSPSYGLSADFQNVAGLDNGAEVRVGGIHAGTVERIELPQQPDGKVTVIMRMNRGTESILRKDSVASIKTEGLLGDKYVDISFGSGKAAEVENGDSIRGETPEDVAAKAGAAMSQAGDALASFKDNMEALKHNFLLRGFYKKRGYYDESQLTEARIARLPAGRPAKEFSYDAAQVFDHQENAKLTNHRALNAAGKFLKENPFGVAVVAVHGKADETSQERIETEARAKVLRDYLAQNFKLDEDKIKTFSATASGPGGAESAGKIQILVYPAAPVAAPPVAQAQASAGGS